MAYAALLKSLAEPKSLATNFSRSRPRIDDVTLSDKWLEARVRKLKELKWPKPKPAADRFFAIALEEFVVATNMERLACERVILARRIRSGGSVPARRLRRHAADLDACSLEFARLWRLRNRPSRLRDNLNGFRNAAREARSLAN